jgi:hypothetical protein
MTLTAQLICTTAMIAIQMQLILLFNKSAILSCTILSALALFKIKVFLLLAAAMSEQA